MMKNKAWDLLASKVKEPSVFYLCDATIDTEKLPRQSFTQI